MLKLGSNTVYRHNTEVARQFYEIFLPAPYQQALANLVESERRYVQDLSVIVNIYYKQFKLAITAGHLAVSMKQLDDMFLNRYCSNSQVSSLSMYYMQ